MNESINILTHIGFIMDGNGRWAQKYGKPRTFGHKEGAKKVKEVCSWCIEYGIKIASFYAFSKENWKRPKNEVETIFSIIKETYKNEFDKIKQMGVKIIHIGDKNGIPNDVLDTMNKIEKESKENDKLVALICLNYSGRFEIVNAIKNILYDFEKGLIKKEDIDEKFIFNYLYTKSYPEPDLIIRTSGELRLSNFLIYQAAYSELYFEPQYWPEYSKENFVNAINDYLKRKRRFGAI
ncbi:MAG: polyprenyl diphosphate synthase [Spirochaetes bacterium]|nr:polyprenyl diphosphate synthase [Spirochaetota bacterium]